MKKDKTEIIILLDRSGSMDLIKEDMEGGIKTFIEDQRTISGDCRVSYYRFDNEWEMVFDNIDINHKDANEIKLRPRGATALLDAIGKTVNVVGERLEKTPENDRPEKIVFVIITDGLENDSREFSREQVMEKIKHQEEKYNWEFVYLGANQDAIKEGGNLGVFYDKSITYSTTKAGIANTYDMLSSKLRGLRTSNESITFNAQDRQATMVDDE